MRCHVAQPNHCVALGIYQDRLMAQVNVRQAKQSSRSGFVTRFGQLAWLGLCGAGRRSPAAAISAVPVDKRTTKSGVVRMQGGMYSAEGRRREVPTR